MEKIFEILTIKLQLHIFFCIPKVAQANAQLVQVLLNTCCNPSCALIPSTRLGKALEATSSFPIAESQVVTAEAASMLTEE